MPRSTRECPGHAVYHVLNRAVARGRIFDTDGDYAAFVKVFRQAVERQEGLVAEGKAKRVEVLGWCLMPNHWHLVLYPHGDGELSGFMRWLQMTHTQRWHAARRSAGTGPLYQGRFKSFPVDEQGDGGHLPTVVGYVERNAVRAGLSETAAAWPWGSLGRRGKDQNEEPGPPLMKVEDWPGDHAYTLRRWRNAVEKPQAVVGDETLSALRECLARGRPYGREGWVKKTADEMNLSSTLRARGRPRKRAVSV